MSSIWFVVWLVANLVGGREPVHIDPINVWTRTLVVAAALDLARQHAPGAGKPPSRHG